MPRTRRLRPPPRRRRACVVEAADASRSGAARRPPASRRRSARAPAGRATRRRAAAGRRTSGAARARAPARAAGRGCAPSAAAPSSGTSGDELVVQRAQRARSVATCGTLESSAKETWMPFAASAAATGATSPAGACTIRPTSGWVVVTRTSGCTCSSLSASALTSSVEAIQPPTSTSSVSCVGERHQAQSPARDRSHPSRRLQHHVDRRRVLEMRRPATGSPSHAPAPASRSSAKLAWTCVRSSSVSLARRSRSSAAIARVFSRACPTGRP